MERTVYINGQYFPESEAKVSVFDRGFLFADAVYEVTSVINGKLVDSAGHMARLTRSCRELGITLPVEEQELQAIHKNLIEKNQLNEGGVYLQLTRGSDGDRDFGYHPDTPPTLVMFTQVKALLRCPQADKGIGVISLQDIRWKRRDIKTTSLLAACMAKQAAKEAGVTDAWLIEDGFVTEGGSNNAYIVTEDNVLVTRPLSNDILHGITRASLLKLADSLNLTVEERLFTIEEAYKAKEAFISSATTFVWPVVEIDGHTIGDGKPGTITNKMREIYIETATSNIS
ncbi:D-amino-acid transaminase [Vibrio sp. 99-8-1]|uniref:D-amino-acid transaminase n=1 Tax=Vibrio sp. 99-8-1 TaxID=2607602 RepID=UPI001493CF8A|nr:D-amino-acid transaminase [Vibrio sp. 99-8-1]NOI65172.1 D-amino-acid transaminase [Vibrio sp. 99-8-1]